MDAQQLYDLLKSLGVDLTGIQKEDLDSRISETIVLKKFEGDQPEPIETIVIKDGVVVER